MPSFKHTILVGPDKRHLTPLTKEFPVNVQTDFVAKTGIGVGKEILVGDIFDEGVDIKNPVPFNFIKEFFLYLQLGKQQLHKVTVNLPRPVNYRRLDKLPLVIHKA